MLNVGEQKRKEKDMRGPKRGPKNLSLSFTEKWLRNAQPAPGEASTRYSDTACVGLCARVGKRRVVFYAKAGGLGYNIGSFIGPAPRWTLFEARQRCEEIRRAVAHGDDPAVMTCTNTDRSRSVRAIRCDPPRQAPIVDCSGISPPDGNLCFSEMGQ